MELNFNEVPGDILTGKDLDYLSDMFQWNYGAVKSTDSALNAATDQEIVDVLQKGFNLFQDNLNSVLNILESRGNASE